jgi:hypothetical protein
VSEEEEFQQLADDIEAIDAYVKRLLTPEELERRLRACLEACGYAMPEGEERAGPAPLMTPTPAPDLIHRPSAGDGIEGLPRTSCHATGRPAVRRGRRAGHPANTSEPAKPDSQSS